MEKKEFRKRYGKQKSTLKKQKQQTDIGNNWRFLHVLCIFFFGGGVALCFVYDPVDATDERNHCNPVQDCPCEDPKEEFLVIQPSE